MRYESGCFSEEETNSLLNIQKQINNSSGYSYPQPSFFEKISTGANTDSDLRVIRIDPKQFNENGEFVYKEREPVATHAPSEDQVPKFKIPVPSQKQFGQDTAILSTQSKSLSLFLSVSRYLLTPPSHNLSTDVTGSKIPQFLLFEDFKVRDDLHANASASTQSNT